MPTVSLEGTDLRYGLSGPADRPTIAFLPDATFGPWSWGWQQSALAGIYQTLVFVTPGTYSTPVISPCTIDHLTEHLETVLSDAEVPRVHLVGAGLGGMVALRYARSYGRVRSLALFGIPPSGETIDIEALQVLHPPDADQFPESLSVAFTELFRETSGFSPDILTWRRDEDATGTDRNDHLDAVTSFNPRPLAELTVPALLFHGRADPVVPVTAGQELANRLPAGEFQAVHGKRCCYIEHSTAVTDRLEYFIENIGSSNSP